MKKFLILILGISVLFACNSSKRLYKKGNYDATMKKSAKKIRKSPDKYKEVDLFLQSYQAANRIDNDKIKTLRTSGDPSNYSKIYSLYKQIKQRQLLAKTLPSGIGVNFDFQDVDKEMKEFKNKTVEYDYAKGVKLLKENNRQSARDAYQYFVECKSLNSNYKDVNDKIAQARYMGTTNVIFTRKNSSGVPVPNRFFDDLSSMQPQNLNMKWLNFDNHVDTNLFYDYEVQLNMRIIAVSPGKIIEKPFKETRKIKDGYKYVKDNQGNVKKDSSGNDIKEPKYKIVSCEVADRKKEKSAHVQGDLIFKDLRTGETLKVEKAAADAVYEDHSYKVINGNMNALSDDTRKLLNKPESPFPPDPDMLMQASQTLRGICENLIAKNRSILQ